MSLGRKRPQNRKERRRKSSRGQRSEGAGRDLFIAIAAFTVVILLGILGLAYLAG